MNKLKYIFLITIFLLLFSSITKAQNRNELRYSVNISNVVNDQLSIELEVPLIDSSEIIFRFPKIVPGTYSIYDFGKFVSNLTTLDKAGNKLNVVRIDNNSWRINQANLLNKITYTLDDTWDTDSSNFVFEPAGTSFNANKYFMFNTHGMFGYFENMEYRPIHLVVNRPANFYGATSMVNLSTLLTQDSFIYKSYHELVDSPILYSQPDTITFYVGKTKVLIALYDESFKIHAHFLADQVKPVLQSASDYFGGNLPVNNYSFLVYLFKGKSRSGSNGALEHSYSSVYYLPSQQGTQLAQYFKDIAAHEFYHVITPLTIHSKEIGEFNYAVPNMSKHLWLYEGVTEYFSHYVQLRSGLLSKEQYVDVLKEKVNIAANYYNDTLPFTNMSKGCLDKYKKEYGNVYQKGALIALGLDLLLLQKSNGEYNLKSLIHDLSLKYGKDNSFNDETLFSEITNMTYPEVGVFFSNYVEGNKPLPLEEMFAAIGLAFKKETYKKGFSIGVFSLGIDRSKSKQLFIATLDEHNEINKSLGYKIGDKLHTFNKKKVKFTNYGKIKSDWEKTVKEGDIISIVVKRKNEKGKYTRVKLKTTAHLVTIKKINSFEGALELNTNQQELYKKWCCY